MFLYNKGTKMGKLKKDKNIFKIVSLLQRINTGENLITLRHEAQQLISTVKPSDINWAEQFLLDNGYPAKLAQQLISAFVLMGLLDKNQKGLRADLSSDHLLYLISTEHDLMRCYISDLIDITGQINKLSAISEVSIEYRRLTHLAMHLNPLKEHFYREHDIIFPYLSKYGLADLCKIAINNHELILIEIRDLVCLTLQLENIELEDFKLSLSDTTNRLTCLMSDVLAQEDSILYPLALNAVEDHDLWKQLKQTCNEIGYCPTHT